VSEVFAIFLRLGLTSFGGPVAHLAYFRDAFVARRRWLAEDAYAAIVAFCQFLPGPASSQVAMALGGMRAGAGGLIAAFIAFTLPSALLMALFALFLNQLGDAAHAPWVHGLKLAAVAIVAQALWLMAKSLTPDWTRRLLAAGAAALALLANAVGFGALGQIVVIVAGGILGALLLKAGGGAAAEARVPRHAPLLLALFFVLLLLLPLLAFVHRDLALFEIFYRTGSLVFGGGHVVLPLLKEALVAPGWISEGDFLAGYGAAQAMPGPLFSFAAFLGMTIAGWQGALLCLFAIYLPSLLLVAGGWPLWQAVAHRPALRAALMGVNAAVVGLLAAALYDPVISGAVFAPADIVIALLALAALLALRAPSWAVVIFCALAAVLAAWLH
jgi:chromate transporter